MTTITDKQISLFDNNDHECPQWFHIGVSLVTTPETECAFSGVTEAITNQDFTADINWASGSDAKTNSDDILLLKEQLALMETKLNHYIERDTISTVSSRNHSFEGILTDIKYETIALSSSTINHLYTT